MKNIFKKTAAIALTAVLAVSLSACGNKDSESGTSADDNGGSSSSISLTNVSYDPTREPDTQNIA
ncbi:MAG: hypothetical protein K2K44_02885 [Oscillospiraceae bacterium]|nr:hypothetical protein [Oscillospiraceae bacterium]